MNKLNQTETPRGVKHDKQKQAHTVVQVTFDESFFHTFRSDLTSNFVHRATSLILSSSCISNLSRFLYISVANPILATKSEIPINKLI